MRKILSFMLILLLLFAMTACGQTNQNETGKSGSTDADLSVEIDESTEETELASEDGSSEPSIKEENTMKAEFDFEKKTVTLNSGYEMPINGLGTYSLHGDECINSVKSALLNGVRLIDTASAYGNEEEVGQAIREAVSEGIVQREDVFVTTKIYPGDEMKNPTQSIQACLDRLNIGYVDLMLLHHPDPNDVESYKAMEQL